MELLLALFVILCIAIISIKIILGIITFIWNNALAIFLLFALFFMIF